MAKRIKALLLKFPGTNCEQETERALSLAGFVVENFLWRDFYANTGKTFGKQLAKSNLLVIPAGFSYGDYSDCSQKYYEQNHGNLQVVSAGRTAGEVLRKNCFADLQKFISNGGHILGICNGWQILCELGLLSGKFSKNSAGKFLCEWVKLVKSNGAKNARSLGESIFLAGLPVGEFDLPIACGQGFFQEDLLKNKSTKTVLSYVDDVTGSDGFTAGSLSSCGQIFGMMPHPERFIFPNQHPYPDWQFVTKKKYGWGFYFFRSIYDGLRS